MMSETYILRRIAKNKLSLKKFRAAKDDLDKAAVKRAIYTLQEVNRNLNWVLKGTSL